MWSDDLQVLRTLIGIGIVFSANDTLLQKNEVRFLVYTVLCVWGLGVLSKWVKGLKFS